MPWYGTENGHNCPAQKPKDVAPGDGKNGMCHICMHQFVDISAHANAAHFPCGDCDKFFALQSTLDLHVAEQHVSENAEEQ